MYPAIAAALIHPTIKILFRENPAEMPVWEKIRQSIELLI
jgi:hypothetical protein